MSRCKSYDCIQAKEIFSTDKLLPDGRGDVVYDLREQVVEEVEGGQDYLARCQNWDKDMGRVWRSSRDVLLQKQQFC
jgi:hypothetical protein